MNYVLSESTAKKIAALLKDARAVKPARPTSSRTDRAAPVNMELYPFKVVGAGDGWRIYLPGGCVAYKTQTLVPSGVTAYGADGWYTIDSPGGDIGNSRATAKRICLVIVDGGTGGALAQIVGETAAASVSGAAIIAPIASVFNVADGSNNARVAEQIARSAFAFGGGGGGGGGGTTGFTGTKDVIYAFDGPRSDGKLYAKTKTWTYQDGLLKSVSTTDGAEIVVADTIEHSGI